MNTVKIELTMYQNLNSQGNVKGRTMYGFTISDGSIEKTYKNLTLDEFILLVRLPQNVFDRVMELWVVDFRDTILYSRGFYINDTWYAVDNYGKIINNKIEIKLDAYVSQLQRFYISYKNSIITKIKSLL